MFKTVQQLLRQLTRLHLFGGLAIVLLVSSVISTQVGERASFADSELHQDVMDRWGTPIDQAAPSLRYVESGAVFTRLAPLALAKQVVQLDAVMNYRKRGLVYFSGFDFAFHGTYEARNTQDVPIDAVFVLPLGRKQNQVLLSDLAFEVNGAPVVGDVDDDAEGLTWTGRMAPGEVVAFDVKFRGRGLDHFTYRTDPALPVRDLSVVVDIQGGRTIDYALGVVPAHAVSTSDDRAHLQWNFSSLEAGVPVGVVLPSVQAYDEVIARMVARAWAPGLLFLLGLGVLAVALGRRFAVHEAYLLAASYAFFFVFVAYLAAFMNFHVAWGLALVVVGALSTLYVRALLGPASVRWMALLLGSTLVLPTLAVILEGYTGLIYCLEILGGIALAMRLTTHPSFNELRRRVLDDAAPAAEGAAHV